MHLRFDIYWPLLFLLLIPYVWWAQRGTLTDMTAKQLRLLAGVRSAILAMLALTLMQPAIDRSGSWVSVVYLLDVSQSVAPSAVQSAIQWIKETNSAGRAVETHYIPFASNSAVLSNLDDLKNVEVANKAVKGSIDRTATNLEGAFEAALHSFDPHYLKRLVLISDGNENTGRIMGMLSRLKAEGVRVYTMPVQSRMENDVWIESVVVPPEIPGEGLFPVEVQVDSQRERPAEVEIRYAGKKLGSRSVQLAGGLNRVAFEASVKDETGPITIEAEVKAADDPFPANNQFRASSVVAGRPKVLYVEGHTESARYLQTALTTEGISVNTVMPAAIPSTIEQLDAYDALVLSDVSRNSLSARQMQTVATYVHELGGGFILAGGENNYGEGGYSKTDIERALPVTFEAKKEKPESVAMIVVLDKSGSMGGEKMELAKEATKAPLQLLKDTDQFGVVAFEYNYYWPVPFQSLVNKGEILTAISSIIAGGETNIFPALREASTQLEGATADTKHIILLSDGRTLPEDFQGLVTKLAKERITVSTIAVGLGADRDLLADIARWGRGRTYYLSDPKNVPQIFIQETERATGKTLREEEFKPVVKKYVEAFKGIDFNAVPALLGYVSTKPKDTSEVLIESTRKDPILARWQYGLGKTAAFTSDLKDRWAVQWLRWNGYPKFWSQLVRQTMRQRDNNGFDFFVAREGNEAKITLNAIQKDGRFRDKLDTKVRVVDPDESVSEVSMRQIGPGYYEARFPLQKKGSYLFRAVGDETIGLSRVVPFSYPDEYHFYPPNSELLRTISSETKGRFQPAAKEIFDPQGETTVWPTPLWPYFAAVALVLFFTDLLLRRIRLFERN